MSDAHDDADRGSEVGLRLSNGSTLSDRELQVLMLIARGLTKREIAGTLYLSVHTVEYHATHIYQKLGVRNRTEAGRAAQRLQLTEAVTAFPEVSTVLDYFGFEPEAP
jgi:ATP/maltotriose-dependent transcriptional regulator MalT